MNGKPAWLSKTMIVNGLVMVVGAGVWVSNNEQVMALIQAHPRICSALAAVYGVAGIVLRLLTKQPVTFTANTTPAVPVPPTDKPAA